jgi:hypothetical protein
MNGLEYDGATKLVYLGNWNITDVFYFGIEEKANRVRELVVDASTREEEKL